MSHDVSHSIRRRDPSTIRASLPQGPPWLLEGWKHNREKSRYIELEDIYIHFQAIESELSPLVPLM